ncbi:RNA-directed DNA polymerase from mobile element jockey-like [Elysia marginata]|uniref:RNA-directed DNA polymerase from mobile element jockey-like n=1 Tax=Elysia marginata TaxID=1093978 RepID=A0AAV4HQS1_9GAST|nr:RNA-directed DNA polymerase from mobile element jockey-like [Elysia marginata]
MSYDPVLAALSEKQKQVRIKINESKSHSKKKELKAERNKLLHELQSMVKCKQNKELDKAAEDINKLLDHACMFKAVKSLNKKKSENPKIFDADGNFIPIIDEIQTVIARLNNNRACGEDRIPGELIKYGADTLFKVICNILNRVFSEHDEININGGKVITLQNPGKAKGPVTNLRPITLLNTLRKVLSLIVLNRTKHDINEYLSPSQSGFREGRSTSNIVWSHRWLVSKTYAEDIDFFITGIEMSSAFDTFSLTY